MLTSRQLECFEAVARHLHFTRAAAELNVAQPALSQQVRRLERQLGVELFTRTARSVHLTPAGEALFVHAQRVLADLAAVTDEMRGWAGVTTGRIRIGVARALVARVARLLAQFTAGYPGVDVELREESTAQMADDLVAGNLDVATLAAAPPPDRPLRAIALGHEPLVLVVAPAHPWAARGSVRVSELDGRELVLYRPGSAVRDVITAACARAGVQLEPRYQTREYATARALAGDGLAVAILPLTVAQEPGIPVRALRLEPEPTWSPVLAWSSARRPSPALAAFIRFTADNLHVLSFQQPAATNQS